MQKYGLVPQLRSPDYEQILYRYRGITKTNKTKKYSNSSAPFNRRAALFSKATQEDLNVFVHNPLIFLSLPLINAFLSRLFFVAIGGWLEQLHFVAGPYSPRNRCRR